MTSFEDFKPILEFWALAGFSLLGTLCLLFACKSYRIASSHQLRLYSATGILFGIATISAQFAVFLVPAPDDAWHRILPSLFLLIAYSNTLVASICIYSKDRFPGTRVEKVIVELGPLLTPVLAYHQTPQNTPPVWFSLVLYGYVAISLYFTRNRVLKLIEMLFFAPSPTKSIAESADACESPN